jgi:hypothetical protein
MSRDGVKPKTVGYSPQTNDNSQYAKIGNKRRKWQQRGALADDQLTRQGSVGGVDTGGTGNVIL